MKPNKQTMNRAKVFSQWFGRLCDKALGDKAKKEGKTFHSFRHAVTDQLRRVNISDEMRYSLLGWTDGSSSKNAGYGYGEGFSMTQLKEVIDRVQFGVNY